MDVSRMNQGQQIAAAGGALLILFLFLNWVGGFSGWEINNTFDVYLLITGGVAIWAALTGSGASSVPGVTKNGATALLGGVALVLLLWLTIFDFPDGASRGIGLILSIPAAAMIAYGGFVAGE